MLSSAASPSSRRPTLSLPHATTELAILATGGAAVFNGASFPAASQLALRARACSMGLELCPPQLLPRAWISSGLLLALTSALGSWEKADNHLPLLAICGCASSLLEAAVRLASLAAVIAAPVPTVSSAVLHTVLPTNGPAVDLTWHSTGSCCATCSGPTNMPAEVHFLSTCLATNSSIYQSACRSTHSALNWYSPCFLQWYPPMILPQ